MEPAILPASHGWLWVLHGFALFRAYAALWLLLLFFYWICLMIVGVIPVVGPMLALCAVPGISAGLMVACEAAQRRQPPTLRLVLEPFSRNRAAQLRLGLAYMAGWVLALAAGALLDGGLFLKASLGLVRLDAARDAQAVGQGVLAFMGAFSPIMLLFWFAPALVHWHGMAPAKAMFFSFFACWRNWRAFLVYGLGWTFFLVAVPFVGALLLGLILTPDIRGVTIASFIITPYMFAALGALFCSFYSTYASVFPPSKSA